MLRNKEFADLLRGVKDYITAEKTFVENHARIEEVEYVAELAKKMFEDANVYIKQDPMKLGALIVCIESYDIALNNIKHICAFSEVISKASNLEIYATNDGNIRCSILFNDAFIIV